MIKSTLNRGLALVALAAIFMMRAESAENVISIDFQGAAGAGPTSVMGAGEIAGVVARSNWNTFSALNATQNNLTDETGTNVFATVTVSGCPDLFSTPLADIPGNNRMMKGYLDTTNVSTTTVAVTGIPAYANGFSVIVYCNGGGTNRQGAYTIGATTINCFEQYLFAGTFVNSVNITATQGTAGNFVVFPGLSGNSFTLTATPQGVGGVRAPVNGIQIVPTTLITSVPIAMTGYNADVVQENPTPPGTAVTFDGGTACWFEAGLGGNLDGLPPSSAGQTFTSGFNGAVTYSLQAYNGNNVLQMTNGAPTASLTVTTPAAYQNISVLASSGSGGGTGTFVINFTDATVSAPINFTANDWGNAPPPVALGELGRSTTLGNTFTYQSGAAGGGFALFETDVDLVALGLSGKSIQSITFTKPGAPQTTSIFAVNGSATLTLTWTGAINGIWDTTTANWKITGSATPTTYTNGAIVTFDDTGANPAITVTPGTVAPAAVFATNSVVAYSIGGNPIISSGLLSMTGTGSIRLANPNNTFSGGLTVTAGRVISVAPGCIGTGAVTLNGGTLSVGAATVANFGGNGAGWTLNNGATVVADVATLTDNNGNENRSLFNNTLVNYSNGFTVQFTYTPSGALAADGTAFVLQNDPRGATALGATGGALGYGGGGAITPSAAIQLNLFNPNTIGTNFETNGGSGVPYTPVAPVNLAGGNPINVTLAYDGTTLTETLAEQTTTNTFTIQYATNLSAVLGNGGNAFVGFTGGTGGAVSTQTISNFAYYGFDTGTQTAVYTNNISTTAGTASGLQADTNGAVTLGTLGMGANATLNVTGVNIGAGGYTINLGATTLAAGPTFNVANNSGAGTLSLGSLNDGGVATTITNSGNGTLILDGAATSLVTGTQVNIAAGTLNAAFAGDLGTLAGVDVAGGSTFSLGAAQTIGALSNSGSVVLNGNTLTVGSTNNLSSTFTGIISDGSAAGALTKAGTGMLTLSGNSTFTGTLTINAGNVLANAGNNVIDEPFSPLGNPQTAGRQINVNAGATLTFGANDVMGNASSTAPITININGGTVTNNGNWFNDLGPVTLNGGTLSAIGGFGAPNYESYYLSGGVSASGAPSTISASGANSGIHLTAADTFNVAGGANLTISATLIDQTGNQGNLPGGLVKTGAGTLILSANNTYAAATSVNAGVLLVNGSLAALSNVTVAAGSILGGTGTINGSVSSVGGTVSPGSPDTTPGILNSGALTLNAASTFNVQINGTTPGTNYDQLNVAGALSLGNATLSGTVAAFTPALGSKYTIIPSTGGSGGTTFAGLPEGASVTMNGFAFQISYVGGTGNDVVLTRVAGPPAVVSVETKSDGSGVVVPAQNLVSGNSIVVFSIRRDALGDFVDNVAADSWTLSSPSGGVAAGDLIAALDSKSATFTGHLIGSAIIHASSAALPATDSGTITVVVGAAASVSVETKNDGTGVVVPAQNLASGSSIVVFSIRRDSNGNFVDNVAADSWTLNSITGGVVAGDLVAAGNLKSATFTGHVVGSAVIHAPSGALATTDSGVITVVPSASVTAVASSVAPSSLFQQAVIFTATISGGGVVPTGSVVFTIDNGAPSAPVALANGSALFTVSTLSVTAAGGAPHNIAATYSGDANHTGSSGNVTQTVTQAGTNTVVAAAGNPVPFGQSVVLNTSVAPVPAGPVLPTGSVTIAFGNQSKTVALNGGAASLTIPGLTPGNYTITVTYLGDGNFTQSVSSSFTETISDIAPVANPQSVIVGQNTPTAIALTGSDSLGNPISFAIATQPVQGALVANPATAPVGTVFTYTPAPGFVGNDSFTFTTTDGFLTSLPATVSILVSPPPNFGSPPSITPNPALAGQQIVFQFSATSPLGPVIITWNFGDGTTGTGTTVSHTYTQPGAYTLTVTATAPSGAASVIPMEVFVGNALTGSSLNGVSGNGTLAPGDTGIIVGAPGIGKASGGAAKLHVDYVHRTKTKFTGQVGTVNFPPLVAQGGLAGLPGIVIVGTPPNAPAYYVTVNSKGRGKATGMLFKIDSKKQLIQFTASGRPELTNLIEAIGGAYVPNTKSGPIKLLSIPVTMQFGNVFFQAMTFKVNYHQTGTTGKGVLAQ